MTLKRLRQIAAVAIVLTAVCVSAYAQKTVYKWVDEDGVVHFSDAPPGEENTAETETVVIPACTSPCSAGCQARYRFARD